ncbi:MAG TPA: DUF1585 domain-containing protein, partial [Blastocatellia bacterium]
ELRKLESIKPDRGRFPDFDEYLRMSMRRETELFFDNIVREDRSILDFVDGNYTFLNERLAQLYKIPGVSGPEFRRVELTGTERGGVLTQASVLTVSSYATRTSPVLRGKWILENFDAIGAWRVRDGKFAIDATGTLPDGRSFKGPRELKTILRADRDSFAEGLTEKLLTYALGRGLERYDRSTVKQITKQLAADDYRFSTLVLEIVKSLPFQMRRGEQAL